MVVGLAEDPGQLHEGGLGEHVVEGHHADVEEVAAGVVDVHLGVAPQRLNRHHHVNAGRDGPGFRAG